MGDAPNCNSTTRNFLRAEAPSQASRPAKSFAEAANTNADTGKQPNKSGKARTHQPKKRFAASAKFHHCFDILNDILPHNDQTAIRIKIPLRPEDKREDIQNDLLEAITKLLKIHNLPKPDTIYYGHHYDGHHVTAVIQMKLQFMKYQHELGTITIKPVLPKGNPLYPIIFGNVKEGVFPGTTAFDRTIDAISTLHPISHYIPNFILVDGHPAFDRTVTVYFSELPVELIGHDNLNYLTVHWQYQRVCDRCGNPGHLVKQCPFSEEQLQDTPQRTQQGKKAHDSNEKPRKTKNNVTYRPKTSAKPTNSNSPPPEQVEKPQSIQPKPSKPIEEHNNNGIPNTSKPGKTISKIIQRQTFN